MLELYNSTRASCTESLEKLVPCVFLRQNIGFQNRKEEPKMTQQEQELFEKLGYTNTKSNRMRLFHEIISQTEEQLEVLNMKEVKNLIQNKQSFIYVEAKIICDCGLNWIPRELDTVHKKRNIEKCDIETYQEVFGSNLNPTIEESIIAIANYRLRQKQVKWNMNSLENSEKIPQASTGKRKLKEKSKLVSSTVAITASV